MKFYLLLIILLINGCADNSELTLQKIERLDKKNKLSDYISKIQTMDELNHLMSLLSDDLKKQYLSSTAQKEQDLRFPRPTPMTLEYLDSITNRCVLSDMKPYLDEVDFTLTNQEINDRLKTIENYSYRDTKSSTNINYNTIFLDPITKIFYIGKYQLTNGFDDSNSYPNKEVYLDNNISFISNISANQKLYIDSRNNQQFILNIEMIYDRINLYTDTELRIIKTSHQMFHHTNINIDTNYQLLAVFDLEENYISYYLSNETYGIQNGWSRDRTTGELNIYYDDYSYYTAYPIEQWGGMTIID